MTDALRRASARRITAVIPYFGYARQDRKPGPRTPISAKLVANLITRAGADRVLTVDLHAGQIQGFFDIPTDNLYAAPVLVRDIKERLKLHNVMAVSPDVGGVVRAQPWQNASAHRSPLSTSAANVRAIGSHEYYRRRCRQDLHPGRRHRRSGGHFVQRRRCLLGTAPKWSMPISRMGSFRRSGGANRRILASRELVLTDTIQSPEPSGSPRYPGGFHRALDRRGRSLESPRKKAFQACSTNRR